ncbi:hypothetical protein L195_g057520, partial [Trifolium pratense]
RYTLKKNSESAARTSNIPPPKVASTVRTSNVSHHHVLHAACATRTSNDIPPFNSQPCDSETQISSHDATPHTMPSTTRTSNGTHTNTAPHIRESAARTSNVIPPFNSQPCDSETQRSSGKQTLILGLQGYIYRVNKVLPSCKISQFCITSLQKKKLGITPAI